MKSRAGALVAIAVAAATSASAARAQLPLPTTFAAPARIAYVADGDVYTISADGSGRRRLTTKEGDHANTQPAWAPDGRSIAFVRDLSANDQPDVDDYTQTQIWLVDPDGSNQRPFAPPTARDSYETSPEWSPDSSQLAFTRTRLTRHGIVSSLVVSGPDGAGARTVAEDRADLASPAWSPDGKTLLYTRVTLDDRAYFQSELWSVPAAGGEPRRIAKHASEPAWSPDGQRIAFVSVRDRNGERCGSDECSYAGELYVVNADGSGRTRLTNDKGDERAPSWSADGRRIAFQSDRNYPAGEKYELYSIEPDGNCMTWLTNGTAQSGDPDWEPGPGPTDPGGCGATSREPLNEAPVATVEGFDGFPVYWLGATSEDGLMLDSVLPSRHQIELGYGDCARYDPSGCPAPLTLRNESSCRAQILWLAGYQPRKVTKFGGALLYRGPEGYMPQLYVGPTTIWMGVDEGAPLPFLRALRQANGESRPGELPRAQLPESFWRRIERAAAARRKYGTAGAARRLHHSRTAIKERDAIHRRLRQLGRFGRLRCPG